MALTFAKYVIQPFFPGCDMPEAAIRLIAALSICKLLQNFQTKINQI